MDFNPGLAPSIKCKFFFLHWVDIGIMPVGAVVPSGMAQPGTGAIEARKVPIALWIQPPNYQERHALAGNDTAA